MPKTAVSVIIPVLNEEANLPDTLASLTWADEVIVVDSGSVDKTCSIALSAGARVVQFERHPDKVRKKAWSLANVACAHDWVLFLDGDERTPPALQAEIALVLNDPQHDGYYLDREWLFRGRRLRCHRPDWNLRLFRQSQASIEDLGLHHLSETGDTEIHEHFIVSGTPGFLKNALLHDDYRGIGAWIDRHNRYAIWEAHLYQQWRAQPLVLDIRLLRDPVARNRMLRRIWIRLPGRPLLRTLIWLIGKRAFRDGRNGILYAFLMGWYELLVGLKLRELEANA